MNIIAEYRPDESIIHDSIKAHDILDKTTYFKPLKLHAKIFTIVKTIMKLALFKPFKLLRFMYDVYLKLLLDFHVPLSTRLSLLWDNSKWALLFDVMSRKKRFDIIHCHFGQNGIHGAYLKHWGIPGRLVITFYGTDLTQYVTNKPSSLYSFLFKKGDLFLPICQFFKDILIDLKCNPKKIEIHHIGIDLGFFCPAGNLNSDQEPSILSVGRLVNKKGFFYSIKSIERLKQQYPAIKLSIIGDGPNRAYLEKLIRRLQLESNVEMLGARNKAQILEYLHHSNIFLLPSVTTIDGEKEGTPTVLMEAQAMKIPVVSTWHAGIPEVVEDGISGFLIKERDIQGIVLALKKLIANPDLRMKMGEAGRKIVSQNFNNEILVTRLISLYSKLLNGSKEKSTCR